LRRSGRGQHGGSFAALLWSRNESCLANDDSNVHLDPTPQIFWRSLGALSLSPQHIIS
jgi:hypothetical protein